MLMSSSICGFLENLFPGTKRVWLSFMVMLRGFEEVIAVDGSSRVEEEIWVGL